METPATPPPRQNRRMARHSTLRSGRTIAEHRERLQTAAEREDAHRKIRRTQISRFLVTFAGFAALAGMLFMLGTFLFAPEEEKTAASTTSVEIPYAPTIEVIDEATGAVLTPNTAGASSGSDETSGSEASSSSDTSSGNAAFGSSAHVSITSRMSEYIGQAEADFRELGYTPVKAVIPSGSIREVDFYLDGQPGRIKTIIDRGTGVTVEDADRMLRYLASIGVTSFEYIDVRVEGKAYYK
ncbi:hypothetical protein IJ135_01140 [Candidatus Saccharibacteria bacterium]|nr:hypothetical protein [Candidatus Saccharibacteria bacterium]